MAKCTPRHARPWPLLDVPEARRCLAAKRRRIDTLREMIAAGPDRTGHCDDCHGEPLALYADPDGEAEGWEYCARCVRNRQARAARTIQLLSRALAEIGAPEVL